jgi:hypothetical protein
MVELIVILLVVAFVVISSWFVLRKRYCPKCGELLAKRYSPDKNSLKQTPMPLPSSGEPLFFHCQKCDVTYPAWETYANNFNKK